MSNVLKAKLRHKQDVIKFARCIVTVFCPSGLRRWLQAPAHLGVELNPTAITRLFLLTRKALPRKSDRRELSRGLYIDIYCFINVDIYIYIYIYIHM